jgi:hypothetical protein
MDENNEYAQSCLDAVMEAVWKDDDHNEVCGGANSYKTTDGKVVFLTQLNHIIIVVRCLLIILSWNLSASSNFKKKSNFRTIQNWQTNLQKIVVVNQDQHFPWE